MNVKLGGYSNYLEYIFWLLSSEVILGSWGHIGTNFSMYLKFGGYNNYLKSIFKGILKVILGHPGVIWGHISINFRMNLKLSASSN